MRSEVLIAGAGVAGSAAAYFLSSKGFKVVALDRMSSYGKACGDALTLRPGLYKLAEEIDSVKGEVRSYSVYVDGVEASTVEYPSANWIIIDKAKFVDGLRQLAITEGASIIKGVWQGDRGYYTIDARGPYSWKLRGSVMVFRFIAKTKWNPDHAILDFRVAERGFYWIFPADFDGNMVNIGAGFEAITDGKHLRSLIIRYANNMLGSYEILDARGAPVTIWSPVSLVSQDGILRIGEAAGLIISTAGEGNRPAVQSAKYLSEALNRSGSLSQAVVLYKRLSSELVEEVKTSRLLLGIVSRARAGEASRLLQDLPRWFWMEYFRSNVTRLTLAKLLLDLKVSYRLFRSLLSSLF